MTPEETQATTRVPPAVPTPPLPFDWPTTLGGTAAVIVGVVLGFRKRWSRDSKDINSDRAETSFVNTLMQQLQRQEERIAQCEEEMRQARIQHTKDAEQIATLTQQLASLGRDNERDANRNRDLVHQIAGLKQLLVMYAPDVAARKILESDWGAVGRGEINVKDAT